MTYVESRRSLITHRFDILPDFIRNSWEPDTSNYFRYTTIKTARKCSVLSKSTREVFLICDDLYRQFPMSFFFCILRSKFLNERKYDIESWKILSFLFFLTNEWKQDNEPFTRLPQMISFFYLGQSVFNKTSSMKLKEFTEEESLPKWSGIANCF